MEKKNCLSQESWWSPRTPRLFNYLEMTAVHCLQAAAPKPKHRNKCTLLELTAIHTRCSPNTSALANTATEHLGWILVGEIERAVQVTDYIEHPAF